MVRKGSRDHTKGGCEHADPVLGGESVTARRPHLQANVSTVDERRLDRELFGKKGIQLVRDLVGVHSGTVRNAGRCRAMFLEAPSSPTSNPARPATVATCRDGGMSSVCCTRSKSSTRTW